MTLVRWTPFRDLMDIQNEVNRLFNTYATGSSQSRESGQVIWQPLVDIAETEDEITVTAEIPGMNKEDVKISIQDNVLSLKGEKKRETEEKAANLHRVERLYGSFERAFSLPSTVQTDKVMAEYKDGLLTIRLPKAEDAKPKEIDISVK